MKTSLSYLPQIKQDQILQVVAIIKEVADPEKIILFGSYARGNWVEDQYFENGTSYDYISDYDFLIVTKDSTTKEFESLDRIVNRSRNLFKTPVNALIHDIKYVNEGLEIGQYFFSEIIDEGILLFDTAKELFAKPRELSNFEKANISQLYFEKWFQTASDFYEGAFFYLNKNRLRLSAFMLHQSVESFYNTVLLVFYGYKPKTHNIDKLRSYAKPISKELFGVFPYPTANKDEEHLFELLRRGYIDARYKDDYLITDIELNKLFSRVERMQMIVTKICTEKIKSFEN